MIVCDETVYLHVYVYMSEWVYQYVWCVWERERLCIVQCQRQILSADLTTLSHPTTQYLAHLLWCANSMRRINKRKEHVNVYREKMLTALLLIHNKDLLAVVIIYIMVHYYYLNFEIQPCTTFFSCHFLCVHISRLFCIFHQTIPKCGSYTSAKEYTHFVEWIYSIYIQTDNKHLNRIFWNNTIYNKWLSFCHTIPNT